VYHLGKNEKQARKDHHQAGRYINTIPTWRSGFFQIPKQAVVDLSSLRALISGGEFNVNRNTMDFPLK
jgi:hypothetical protein